MRTSIISFFLGIYLCQQQGQLSESLFFVGLSVLLLSIGIGIHYRNRRYFFFLLVISTFLCGFLWAYYHALVRIEKQLLIVPTIDEIWVQGYIRSLPVSKEKGQQFLLQTTRYKVVADTRKNKWQNVALLLQITWDTPGILRSGDTWQLKIAIKPPIGKHNIASFDYQQWLFSQGIQATGWVLISQENQRLKVASTVFQQFLLLRYKIALRLDTVLSDNPYKGIIKALLVGDKSAISTSQWRVFQATGTSHLMAISGLHIGIISSLVFILLRYLWNLSKGCYAIPAYRIAAIGSVLFALFYALLAGFALPTQRALIMLTVAFVAIFKQTYLSAWDIFLLALLGVLLLDPWSVLSAGFYLSFGAVLAIMYVLQGRIGSSSTVIQMLKIQLAVSLFLFPLLILFFQQGSVIAPLVNFILIPVVSLFFIPFLLFSSLFLWTPLAGSLFSLNTLFFDKIWWLLDILASWQGSQIILPIPDSLTLFLVYIGIILLLTPQGWRLRYLGLFLYLPLFFKSYPRPLTGDVFMSVLDVGQGTAIVIQTKNHTLLYDTGRAWKDGDNAQQVILPFFRSQGITQLDYLMLSHADNDHSGGAKSIISAMPIAHLSSGEKQRLNDIHPAITTCYRGQQWQWDQVQFKVLAPIKNAVVKKSNNASCVLQVIDASGQRILLTGDIEKPIEWQLLHYYGNDLQADIVVVPHHGSKSSSSQTWVNTIQAKYAVFTTGYLNQFALPSQKIVQRYQQAQSIILDTAQEGAIYFQLTANKITYVTYQNQFRRYWHTVEKFAQL